MSLLEISQHTYKEILWTITSRHKTQLNLNALYNSNSQQYYIAEFCCNVYVW
jgi:hypothetical protein